MMINCIICTLKILRDLFSETKNKNKKHFCKSFSQCFSSKTVFTEHKKDSLSINGVQSVKLTKWTIKFKNYFKQIPETIFLKILFEIYEGLYSKKKIKITLLVVWLQACLYWW